MVCTQVLYDTYEYISSEHKMHCVTYACPVINMTVRLSWVLEGLLCNIIVTIVFNRPRPDHHSYAASLR